MADPVILSLGSVNIDVQFGVARWPQESETLLAGDYLFHGGGKAANVAHLSRRLGAPSLLLARVGDDEHGRQALAPLGQAGVDLSGTGTAPGTLTGVAAIFVPPGGSKGIVQAPNANRSWDEPAMEAAVATVSQAPDGSVLVVDYEVPAELVARCARTAQGRGFAVVLDPSPADLVERDLLPHVTLAAPNSGEAERMTGIAVEDAGSARRAGEALLGQGVRAAAVKLPDGGCVLVQPTGAWHLDSVEVEVVDATGAGDAFAGAAAVALMEGRDLLDSAREGTAAAHLAVTGWGSQPSYPDRPALQRFAERLDGRVREL